VQELEGGLDGRGLCIGIVAARFNEPLTKRLLEGTLKGLISCGIQEQDITLAWVPGSFEIPLVAHRLANNQRIHAVICLGVVIKKETAHFEHVAEQTALGIAMAARATQKPVVFGVLTTYTEQQAIERSGGDQGNRGHDAALVAIRMANLLGESALNHGNTE